MQKQILDGINVIDLSWYITGPWCTKLLAENELVLIVFS